tara:strand:- start:43553 stop:46030 length:2478 start_codon:yes stop_codon:yes gene_type:complete
VSNLLKRLPFVALILIFLGTYSPDLRAQDTFEITDPTLTTPQEYTLKELIVEGNEVTRKEFIISASLLKEGSKLNYPGDDIPDAVRRLYQAGLFSDVKILIKEKVGNNISLIIQVQEQPRIIEYKLEGIKRSQRRDLKDLIVLLPGVAITESNKAQAINTIKRFYKDKGFWYTEVKTRVELDEKLDNRARLIFEIKPGKRLEIKEIEIVGNEEYSDKKLKKRLKPLKEDKWIKIFSKKVFKKEDFEEGKENLIAFYRKNGFSDARIVSDSVYVYNYVKDLDGVGVKLTVAEGPQYKVRNVSWEGNTVYTDDQLSRSLGFENGDVFDEEKYEANLTFNKTSSDINSLYQNIGYLFFRAIPTISKVAADSIDIHFDIYEDEIASISEVAFSGNTKTHDDVVRRTLRTIPGNNYSREAIVRTIRELGTLGYFDAQSIEPDVLPNQNDKTVDISYSLKEAASTDNFEFSGGYGGQSIGAIVSARVNFNNFSLKRAFEKGGWSPIPSGDGQQVSLGVQVTGSGYQSYSLGFVEPWLNGKPTSLGVNFSYNLIKNAYSVGKSELFSGSVSIGKRLKWPDDFFSQRTILSYQLYDVSQSNSSLLSGVTNTISLTEVIERNSLDNFISPNSGSKISFSAEAALPIPGLSDYYKFKVDYQHHFPVIEKLVLTSQANFGYIGYFTKDERSNFQRFLVGGTPLQQQQSFLYENVDMRGYPGGFSESIAPVVNGEKFGGRIYNKYSLELRYPAITNEQIQVIPYTFVDAGNSYYDFSTYDPFNVKRSAGFGVRLFLPILGLVDLSYGYRLDGVQGGINASTINAGEWEFLFNIGAPF